MTNALVFNEMNLLKETFADGLFWNHDPSQPNNPASVTENACTHHDTVNCGDYTGTGACGCNSFGGGSQCYGFAFYMAYRVFGHYPDLDVWVSADGGSCGNGWRGYGANYLSGLTLEPGDIIRKDGHSAIVHTVSGDTVQVAEVWGNPREAQNNCKIVWGPFNGNSDNKVSVILSTATYILKAPKTTGSTVTVFFDANGGSCSLDSKPVEVYGIYANLPVPTKSGYAFAGWWFGGSTNLECASHTTVTQTASHTVYARWARVYKITNVGAGKCLNITGDNVTSLANEPNVMLWSDSGTNEQKWLVFPSYDDRPIKSVIDYNYGLNIQTSNNNCNVYPTAGNENDSQIYYIDYGDYYRIRLLNYNLHLTAAGAWDGANVYWSAYAENDLQKWTLTQL